MCADMLIYKGNVQETISAEEASVEFAGRGLAFTYSMPEVSSSQRLPEQEPQRGCFEKTADKVLTPLLVSMGRLLAK
jgi:hypothetical protein